MPALRSFRALFTYPSMQHYIYIYVSTDLYIYLAIYLSIYLSIQLPICHSIGVCSVFAACHIATREINAEVLECLATLALLRLRPTVGVAVLLALLTTGNTTILGNFRWLVQQVINRTGGSK